MDQKTPGLAVRDLEEIVRALGNRSRPEVSWISKVTGNSVGEVESAVRGIRAEKETITKLTENITRTGKSYYAQFPAPIELYALVRLARPRSLAESGVASGVSSAFLLMGVRANHTGVLHSIDLPVSKEGPQGNESWAIPRGMASGWAVPGELRTGWDLRKGKSEDLLKHLLDELGTLDFYCHDSPADAAHFAFEMNAIGKYLKPGSLVVADNTDRDTFDRTAQSAGTRAYYRRGSSLGAFRVPKE